MIVPAPLTLHRETIWRTWIDYNGHMRDAYYLVIFSDATDALMDWLGLDAAGRARMGTTLYTLEAHLNYLREVKEGAEVRIDTQLLAHDAKRLHICHAMVDEGAGQQTVAINEQMLLHVDTRGPKATPFHPDVLARIESIALSHAHLPKPAFVGRAIHL